MNDNNKASRKRKTSFANDRLKRLRTSLNNEVVTSSTTHLSKPDFTPSIKNNVQNNPAGYPERKILAPVRKLRNVAREEDSNNYKNVDSSVIPKKPKLSQLNIPMLKCKNVVTQQSINSSHKNIKSIKSLFNKSSIQNSPTRKIEKFSHGNNSPCIADDKTIKRQSLSLKKVNASLSHSALAKSTSSASSTFSDICSTKTKFEYQHVPNVQTTKVNSDGKDCSCPQDNIEYFGQAMKSLYSKLFGPCQDANKNQPENKIANTESMDWEPGDDEVPSNVPEEDREKSDHEMYIIVDTNIFLDSLSILQGIVNYGSDEKIKPVIYVPWMVFNELDFIKDNRSNGMRIEACKAIDFINKMLTDKKRKLIGQSIFEANKQMYVGKSPDDKITSCCLQVKEKGYNAVLLSNDKNLRNKLIINGIPSLSCSEVLKCFNDASPHADKIKTLLEEMKKCCTDIISACCEEAYGSVWNKLALLDKQPWSFVVCLDIFKKYWSAVFREKLLKQFLKSVEKMILILKNSESLKDPETFANFTKDCLSLCFFLMDLEQHKDLIARTIDKINMIVGQKS